MSDQVEYKIEITFKPIGGADNPGAQELSKILQTSAAVKGWKNAHAKVFYRPVPPPGWIEITQGTFRDD